MYFSDTYAELNLSYEDKTVSVKLDANQFDPKRLNQYSELLHKTVTFFEGKVENETQEVLSLVYPVGDYTTSLSEILPDLPLVERLRIAQGVQFLADYQDSLVIPYIHPDNIFVSGDRVRVAHRGFAGGVVPDDGASQTYFNAYRALILVILNPKLSFIDAINGSIAVKNPFSEEVQQSQSFGALNDALNQQAAIQLKKHQDETVSVLKKRYGLYKYGAISLSVLVVVLMVTAGFMWFKTIPYKDRLITAEVHFTNSNYAKTIETLKADDPKGLPVGIKYALAVSAIQQDTLSKDQKENILKNISIKSNENILLYWIYVGFGNAEKTLDIAQNIGDSQLILYAYQKLYNQVSADSDMPGSEKQEKLKTYKEQIAAYEKLLNGEESND